MSQIRTAPNYPMSDMASSFHSHAAQQDGRPQRRTAQDTHRGDHELLETVLNMPIQKNRIVTRAPSEPFRLTFFDVTCLVVNRTIGIFKSQAASNWSMEAKAS